ncbi:MAG TPA: farnesyl diphosphate synthase [Dissulfurispiraceae bacterium]|nr:farnesyl diphosphate synthase [Dissulfurispiraceae bacterium]
MDIAKYTKEKKVLIDSFVEKYFSRTIVPGALYKSITYSLSAGGKRIRPILCLASYEACGGKAEDVVPYASAFELIHTYSLIHDDLPAMDDDDLRRGKPTNHKVFGEGMAILAGDALLTDAFYLLSQERYAVASIPHSALIKAINEIAYGAGLYGMVGGQAQDLLSENEEPDPETLFFIHRCKTAALITAAVKTGGILACCSEERLAGLAGYGQSTGLAFQVIDDILDVEGETEVLGKTTGSDEKKKKMTYPKLYGIEESRRKAKGLIEDAVDSLAVFDEKADPLRAIAQCLLERKS